MFSQIGALALAALASVSSAHTWIEQVAIINATGSIQTEPGTGFGFPRSYVQRGMGDVNQNLIKLIGDPTVSSPMCGVSLAARTQSTQGPEVLTASPGELLSLRWLENGHVTGPRPYEAPKGGPVYAFISAKVIAPTILQALAWTTDGKGGDGQGYLLATQTYDDGRCYQTDAAHPLAVQRAQALPLNDISTNVNSTSDLPCQMNIQVPYSFEPGTYSVFWFWNFTNPQSYSGEYYSSCLDINLVAGTPQYMKSPASWNPVSNALSSIPDYFNALIKTVPPPAHAGSAANSSSSPSAAPAASSPASSASPNAPTTTPTPFAPTNGPFSILSSVPTMSSVNIASILSSEAAVSSSFVSAQLSSSAASVASSSAPVTTSAVPSPSSSDDGILTVTSITTIWDVVYESAPPSMSPVSVTTVTVTSTAPQSTSTNSLPALIASVPSQLAGLATLALSLPSTPSASLSLFVPIETSDSLSTSSAPASATSALLSATTALTTSSSPVPSSTSSTETPPTPTPSVSPSTAATVSSKIPTTTEASTTTKPIKTHSSTTSSAAAATSTYVDPEDGDTTQNKKRKRSAKFRR